MAKLDLLKSANLAYRLQYNECPGDMSMLDENEKYFVIFNEDYVFSFGEDAQLTFIATGLEIKEAFLEDVSECDEENDHNILLEVYKLN